MAGAPGHKLGQLIGEMVEESIHKRMRATATKYGFYLDRKGPRPARGNRKKVAWVDKYGNTHDLDYVLESGGTSHRQGMPRAFIESAWRGSTKHSKNKAQEIQGAVTPIAERHAYSKPFLGAVMAGHYTRPSLDQLRSHGYSVVHCTYESVVDAYKSVGVDVSTKGKDTPIEELQAKVDAVELLTKAQKNKVQQKILRADSQQFNAFFASLQESLMRRVGQITIWPVSGSSHSFGSITDAVIFVLGNDEQAPATEFIRYEIEVRFSNDDEIRGKFREKSNAIEFLESYRV